MCRWALTSTSVTQAWLRIYFLVFIAKIYIKMERRVYIKHTHLQLILKYSTIWHDAPKFLELRL